MSVNDSADQSDLDLCKEIHRKIKEGDLAFGMLSGSLFPKSEAVSMGVIGWYAYPGVKGHAGVDASRMEVWLCLESREALEQFSNQASTEFDQWVEKGGLHVARDWWGPNTANCIPSDYMKVEESKSTINAFSHFYNRWVLLSNEQNWCNKGLLLGKDFREKTVFEMLLALAYSNPGFPRNDQQSNLIKGLGLDSPKNWHTAYRFKPER